MAGTLHPAPSEAAEQSSFPTKKRQQFLEDAFFPHTLGVRNLCSGQMGSLKYQFHSRDGKGLNSQ